MTRGYACGRLASLLADSGAPTEQRRNKTRAWRRLWGCRRRARGSSLAPSSAGVSATADLPPRQQLEPSQLRRRASRGAGSRPRVGRLGQWGSAFTLTVAEDELAAPLGEPPPRPGLLPIPVGTRHACTARLLVGDWPMMATVRAGLQRSLQSGEDSNTSLGPARDSLIKKGLVYAPEHGPVPYTVPRMAGGLQQAAKRLTRGISRGIALRPESPGRPGVPGEQRRGVRPGRR